MPYCPKCDMEFVEGITVCSDCKGPLVESKEVAIAMKRQAEEEEKARKQAEFEAMQKAYEEEMAKEMADETDRMAENSEDTGKKAGSESPEEIGIPVKKGRTSIPRTQVYVKKSQKYSDLRSSADAFLLVGGALTAVSILLWTGFIPFPGSGFSNSMIKLVLTAMGLGSLYISWRSFQSAKKVQGQVTEEENATRVLIQWFTENYTAEAMDAQLQAESGDLSPEELSLKRFELIQDILITNHDLADQSYVDMLAEEIYGKVFEG